jgi:GT2 family glycosyltransferase
MKRISVIIVSWNASALLRDCLNSIQETGGSLVQEIIVVDNASSDGSAAMVETEFPEVQLVLSKENLGFARANNVGLKRASGDYLALVNSDVVVHPDCFERLVTFLDLNREVGLVGPKVYGRDGQLQRTCRRFPTIWNTACRSFALDSVFPQHPLFSGREMRHWNPETQCEVDVLSGCFWLARRAAVEQVGDLDERFFFYAEDMDWCKRFWDRRWKVVLMPTATVTHYDGGSSANAPLRYSIQLLRANLTYWKKHRGWMGQAVFYLLSVLHHAFRLLFRGLRQLFGRDPNGERTYKCRRSFVCLRWLLTGREVQR